MEMKSVAYKTWKSTLCAHLGRKILRHCDGLIGNIQAVDRGLKPSYLYDIGCPSSATLVEVLQNLLQERLIENCLNVLEIGDDLLIVNVAMVLRLSYCVNAIKKMLVDVSESKGVPVVYTGDEAAEKINSCVQSIRERLDSSQICLVKQNITCNASSMFGFLLGYPVVYWFSDDNGNQNNCLAMESLTCVKLTVKWNVCDTDKGCLTKDHVLYSFSYPTGLEQHFINLVEVWSEDLTQCVNRDLYCYEPFIHKEVTKLEAVCL